MARVKKYAKFVVAAVGGAITGLIAILPPNTTAWNVLTVLSLTITALTVAVTPNTYY